MRAAGSRSHLALWALLLPLGFAAPSAADAAAPAAQGASAASPAAETTAHPDASILRGVTGVILKVTRDSIAVRLGAGGKSFITLGGGPETHVGGVKKSFAELRAGDLVALSYQGDPPKAVGIQVLPRDFDPDVAALTGGDPYIKHGREFIGWIKRIDATTMVVRTPNGPPPQRRKGELKTFSREPGTKIEMGRSSWDELKKGDRVAVRFRKGEPRPADLVQVLVRGGEQPLPPGIATLLFDRDYDASVKDVDGIGEWPAGKPWPPAAEPDASSAEPTPAR